MNVLILVLITLFAAPSAALAQINGANGKLQIHYINVGQGDAQLIVSPLGETVLVDSGPATASACASATGLITYLVTAGLTQLDYHIASHYDADHIGCSDVTIARWPVQIAAFDRGTTSLPSTQTYTRYAAAVAPTRQTVTASQVITLDAQSATPVRLSVVAFNGNGVSGSLSENDRSIVVLLTFGEFNAAFGGDLAGFTASGNHDVESTIAASVGQVEVYKVHHHGSATSSNTSYLATIHPRIAMLSMGAPNAYDHPTQATLDRLHAVVSQVYWTTAGDGAPMGATDSLSASSIIEVPTGGLTFQVNYGSHHDLYDSWPSAVAPTITVSPTALVFAATKNGAAGAITRVTGAQTVSVAFSTGSPTWTVSSNQSWVSLSASGGTGTGTFTVSISDASNVIAGNTSLSATITLTSATASNSPRTIAVSLSVDQSNGATTVAAIGGFDSPANDATNVVGAIAVTGWALDDIGVERVEIWRNCLTPIDSSRPGVCRTATPTGAADRVFIGTAAFVPGARTDIETNPIYAGYPQAYRAGWGYLLLTNALPNQATGSPEGGQGPITLYANAIDREGRYTELGSKTVTLNNDNATVPFGAIDTPEQGGTITGALTANFGWAMTRRQNAAGVDVPKCIARTRYRVYIDGVARTLTPGVNWHPNLVRADLTAAYPGLCDSANSLAAYYIDVPALGLTNGTHTIGWDVYDDNGTTSTTADDNVAGIGSRFFNILVAAADAPVEDRLRDRPARRGAAADITALPAAEDRQVRARVGFVDAPVVTVAADRAGARRVHLPGGHRLVVDLGGPVSRGYLIVGDELRDLPIGSTLDGEGGQFYWQPPVPFFGPFELVFVSGADGGRELRTNVSVVVTDPTAGGEPEIRITSPTTGANPNPVITVTGTARDPRAVSGTGITTVHVWAYPDGAGCTRPGTACTTPVFLGEATLVDGAYRLVTAPLAPGTYDLAVFAWVARTRTWAPAAVVNIAVR